MHATVLDPRYQAQKCESDERMHQDWENDCSNFQQNNLADNYLACMYWERQTGKTDQIEEAYSYHKTCETIPVMEFCAVFGEWQVSR